MIRGGTDRRAFLRLLPGLALALGAPPARAGGSTPCHGPARPRRSHPEPREGIDAARVLKPADLEAFPDAIPVFDMVRAMPQIADGIGCACGCADVPGYYSLLSCYEGDGMAQMCRICQGQARLAHGLFRQGRALREIRAAIDIEFA